jgi:hypothetical protein
VLSRSACPESIQSCFTILRSVRQRDVFILSCPRKGYTIYCCSNRHLHSRLPSIRRTSKLVLGAFMCKSVLLSAILVGTMIISLKRRKFIFPIAERHLVIFHPLSMLRDDCNRFCVLLCMFKWFSCLFTELTYCLSACKFAHENGKPLSRCLHIGS